MVCFIIFELTSAFQTALSRNLCATSMILFQSFWRFLVLLRLLPTTPLTVHDSFCQKAYDKRVSKVNQRTFCRLQLDLHLNGRRKTGVEGRIIQCGMIAQRLEHRGALQEVLGLTPSCIHGFTMFHKAPYSN